MFRRFFIGFLLMCIAGIACFGQAAALRDYVGMISQTFHPDIVSFMEEFRNELNKRNYSAAARSVDVYLKGESGTGFVYVANDGRNYILTNFHVISHAHTLSVTFEKPDGEKTRFSDLSIVMADEEMDIALLAFAGGQKPFKESLAFLNRPLQEGEDVYSAGFPGLGTTMVWQLGRGMISNASVRFPIEDGTDRMFGPFIQHTAQIDPGNSGGPLLVQAQGVPSGFAVAGINTRSARYRQAANFSIPLDRVRSFLNESLRPQNRDELARLNARVTSFMQGLSVPRAVYSHIAEFLSVGVTGENAEYALDEIFAKAPKTVQDNIVQTFVNSPVDGMAYAVAWTIEDALRSGPGRIDITLNSVTAIDDSKYTVSFKVNDKTIDSQWVNEYGIWQIRTFGDFAAGDKSLIERQRKARNEERRRNAASSSTGQISANFVYPFDLGPAFGVDIKFSLGDYVSTGFQGFIGKAPYAQIDAMLGARFPIDLGKVILIPFADVGAGVMFIRTTDEFLSSSGGGFPFIFGISAKGGLMLRPIPTTGFFVQAAFQYNFHNEDGRKLHPAMLIAGVGYAF